MLLCAKLTYEEPSQPLLLTRCSLNGVSSGACRDKLCQTLVGMRGLGPSCLRGQASSTSACWVAAQGGLIGAVHSVTDGLLPG